MFGWPRTFAGTTGLTDRASPPFRLLLGSRWGLGFWRLLTFPRALASASPHRGGRSASGARAQNYCPPDRQDHPRLPLLMRRPDQEGDQDGGDQESHGSGAVPALGWRLNRPADHGGDRGWHQGGRQRIGSWRGGSLMGDTAPRPEVGCGRFLPVLDLRERAPHDRSIRRQRVGRGWARPGPRNGRGRRCGHRRHRSRRGRRRCLRWGRRRLLRWRRGGLGARRRRFGRRRGRLRLHRFARVCRERSAYHREHGHRHRRDQLLLHVRSRPPPREGTTPRYSSSQTRTLMKRAPRTRIRRRRSLGLGRSAVGPGWLRGQHVPNRSR